MKKLAPVLVALALTGCNEANRELGHQMTLNVGWSQAEWKCLDFVIMHESAWDHRAVGPAGDYGIPQAFPARKLASEGADWRTNPVVQIRWLLSYVKQRYGSPCRAATHKRRTGWY